MMAALAHVPGWYVLHGHDEHECCVHDGPDRCRYMPTLWSRLKAWFRR